MEIEKESLEKVCKNLNTKDESDSKNEKSNCDEKCSDCQCEKEEQIGFHKGALNTLIAERNELFKMIQNVENIMQAHIQELKKLGVNIDVQKKD